jgi:hypothetical protein
MEGTSKRVTSSFGIYATLMRFVASNNYVFEPNRLVNIGAGEVVFAKTPSPETS